MPNVNLQDSTLVLTQEELETLLNGDNVSLQGAKIIVVPSEDLVRVVREALLGPPGEC